MREKRHILIVEDEIIIAQILKMDLEDVGYDVYDFLTTGEEAIQSIEETKPDVILMDIHLAGKIDGIDTAKEISDKRSIPIIFTTGYSEPEIMKRAEKVKPVAFLQKPVEIWDLKPILDSIFK